MDRKQAKEKAEALVAQMTLEEAASQLRYDAPAIDRLGVPAYNWWNEALHGVARGGTATSFPQAIALAAAFDPELVQRLGDIAATEGRARYNAFSRLGDRGIYQGLTFWSPNINIFRDPRWGRGHETYGEDPFLTSRLGVAYIKGLQGDGEHLKSAACAKHFAVHSGPEALRHSFNAPADKKDMAETYLPAFKAAVQEANVEAVMGAYNAVDGEPCCGSTLLLKTILRDGWGFEGHVVSDCWAVRDFHENHHVTEDPPHSVAMALKAGCDVNCGCTYQHMLTAYNQGLVTEEEIRRAAVRLFTTRYLLGLLDGGSEYDALPYNLVECPIHLKAAEEAAHKGCVLLRNNGILPLDADLCVNLGVVGPNANSRAALVGNYHGTSSRYITVLEGIQNAVNHYCRVMYSEGCHLFKDRVEPLAEPGDRIAEAVAVARHSSVTILVLGLDETLEGEEGDTGNADASGDKLSLLLPESQRKLAEAVLDTGKPVILCLMAGSAIDVGDLAELAAATLLIWYPGARGGKAVADILFGHASPSGKLPVTFYHNSDLEKMPDFTDYSMKNRTYRYFQGEPLFPFGYGLTYGDVHPEYARVRELDDGAEVDVVLVNRAKRDTEDVVQVYVQNEGSELAPPNPRLCAFQRVKFPVDQLVEVKLFVPASRLCVIDREGQPRQEGRIVFHVGTGQPDQLTRKLTGKDTIRLDYDPIQGGAP